MNKYILLLVLTFTFCAVDEDSTHCNSYTESDSKLECLKRTFTYDDFDKYRCCWITYTNKNTKKKYQFCDLLRFKEAKIDEYRDDLKADEDAKDIKIMCGTSYLTLSSLLIFALLI